MGSDKKKLTKSRATRYLVAASALYVVPVVTLVAIDLEFFAAGRVASEAQSMQNSADKCRIDPNVNPNRCDDEQDVAAIFNAKATLLNHPKIVMTFALETAQRAWKSAVCEFKYTSDCKPAKPDPKHLNNLFEPATIKPY
jgi:hypothetical protein